MKISNTVLVKSMYGVSVALALAACSGGGSSSTSSNSTNTNSTTPTAAVKIVKGVAAAGAPVSKGIGYILDATTGTQYDFVTGTDGTYSSADLTGKTGPFLIHVRGITVGGSPVDLYSLASTSNFNGTVNVTQLSDVVVGYAAGKRTDALEAACKASMPACPALLNAVIANLALSKSQIVTALPASVLGAFAVSQTTFDPITTSFIADHTGADGLLDALQVVPPAAGGTSYAINLNGTTPTPLVTVPVTTATTTTAPTTNATAPTITAVAQAADLAKSLAEVQAMIGVMNQNTTAAAPGFVSAATMSAQLDPAFLFFGMNGTQFSTMISTGGGMSAGAQLVAGSLAPYSGAAWAVGAVGPAPSVTYTGNCVSSLWTYFGVSSLVSGFAVYNKTITNPTGCVGTWKFAGNGQNRRIQITPIFQQFTGTVATTYAGGFQFDSAAKDTLTNPANPAYVPYATISVSGPGLTTLANFQAKGAGVAVTVPLTIAPPVGYTAAQAAQSIQNQITGWGSSVLNDCTNLPVGAATTTPCYDSTAAIAGSDYVAVFKDAGGLTLETTTHRLSNSLAMSSVPTNWFSTITSITPSAANLVPLTPTTMTINYTVRAGAYADWGGVFFYNALGAQIMWFEQPVTSQTSNTLNFGGGTATSPIIPAAPATGTVTLIAPIGGLKLVSSKSF